MLTAHQLKCCRYILGLTQQEVADAMYITTQTISQLETGKTQSLSTMHHYDLTLRELSQSASETAQRNYHILHQGYEIENARETAIEGYFHD